MKLKNKNNHSSKIKYIIIAVVVLLVLGTSAVFAYSLTNNNNMNTEQKNKEKLSPEGVDYNDATDEQKQSGIEKKGNTSDQPAPTNPGDMINLVFTALNPPTATNPNLQVRVRIDTITNVGNCTLTLTKGELVVTKQASVQAGPTTSTCQGFDVAGTELSAGQWNATVKLVSGDQTGSVSRMFTVQ